MKKYLLAITAVFVMTSVHAQDCDSICCPHNYVQQQSLHSHKSGVFRNLDLSVTAGTTGIGIDVASKVCDYVQLRAGYEFMPRFQQSIYFPVEVGGQAARIYDDNGNRIESRFDKLSKLLTEITGFQVEDQVEMLGKPTVNNFKLMVDVFPFKKNKHWHFTAGFYWGSSKFAEAVNSTRAMTSLVAVGLYNSMYYHAVNDLPLYNNTTIINEEMRNKMIEYGRMGFPVGVFTHDVYGYYKEDVYCKEFDNPDYKYGEIIHHKGDYGLIHKEGETYRMEPDSDGLVKARAKSNAFKPYLGFGYGGRLIKNRDDWQVSFDAGAMFWGGTPDLITHDGINLTKDVKDASGKVGDWIDLIGGFKVYPVLSVRFTKTIF
jgi:hypothetical protein